MTEWNPARHPRNAAGRFVSIAESLAAHADELRPYAVIGRWASATERGRDEINASVVSPGNNYESIEAAVASESGMSEAFQSDPDKHAFAPNVESGFPMLCAVCGDNESANDHLDPDDPSHVWMDVEGLTTRDIDTLDHFVSVVTRKLDEAGEFDTAELDVATLVADWINGATEDVEQRSGPAGILRRAGRPHGFRQ